MSHPHPTLQFKSVHSENKSAVLPIHQILRPDSEGRGTASKSDNFHRLVMRLFNIGAVCSETAFEVLVFG